MITEQQLRNMVASAHATRAQEWNEHSIDTLVAEVRRLYAERDAVRALPDVSPAADFVSAIELTLEGLRQRLADERHARLTAERALAEVRT